MAGTFPLVNLDTVVGEITGKLGPGRLLDTAPNGYAKSMRFEGGAFLAWTDGRREAFVYLPGQAVAAFDPAELLALAKFLHRLGLRCTRLDVAFDDQEGLLSMRKIHRAGEAGNYAGYKRYEPRRSFDLGTLVGDTAYFGVRGKGGSGRFLRFYDKAMEQGTPEVGHWIRLEVELSKTAEQSERAFSDVVACASVDEMALLLGKVIGGSIYFVNRTSTRLDRSPDLPWWRRLVARLGAVRYVYHRSKTTLQRKMEWLLESVARTAAAAAHVIDASGYQVVDFFAALVRVGERNLDVQAVRDRAGEVSPSFLAEVVRSVAGWSMAGPPPAARGGPAVAPF